MSETVHVRTGSAFPFGPHGDPENGPACAGTECEACGCCQHCEHPCQCKECGCIDHAGDGRTFPSEQSEPALLLAEIKRLRIQLGCVKALATLWEESAAQMERDWQETDDTDPELGDALTHAAVNRSHAAAIRDMLSETPEDDVVDAVILCGQSSGMYRVAECSLPDGHDGQHEDSNTGWMWGK